jgi:hypothetical protein
MNPGPSFIDAFDKLEELPPPPFKLSVRTKPERLVANEPFQVIVTLRSETPRGTWLSPDVSAVQVLVGEPTAKRGEPLAAQGIHLGGWDEFRAYGNLNGRYGGEILLPGGAFYAWTATIPKGAPAGEGEIEVSVSGSLTNSPKSPHQWIRQEKFKVWQPIHVRSLAPQEKPVEPSPPLLTAENVQIKAAADDWEHLEFQLIPAKNQSLHVPGTVKPDGTPDPEKYALRARIEGFAADGTAVELAADRLPHRDTWGGLDRFVLLPAAGARFAANFRPRSRFSPALARLSVKVATDQGIETVLLPVKLVRTNALTNTPFGVPKQGVRLRLGPLKSSFSSDELVRFQVQAENVAGKPIVWGTPTGVAGCRFLIQIDNRPSQLLVHRPGTLVYGWAADSTCQTPDEATFDLLPDAKLEAGRHTLRLRIFSEGGQFENTKGQLIPRLDGTLKSNDASFVIE